MSTIHRYNAAVYENAGSRSGLGTPAEPAVAITGAGAGVLAGATGTTAAPTIEHTRIVPAGERVRLFDRAAEGGFDLFRVETTGEIEIWLAAGAPDDDASAKSSPMAFGLRLPSGRGPWELPTDKCLTNTDPAAGATVTDDVPGGISDGGRLDARIQTIDVVNRGTSTVTVTYSKLN